MHNTFQTTSSHPLVDLIRQADRAITEEDFDSLMDIYADDALLVVKPGLNAVGKEQIRRAFEAIANFFKHGLRVEQGETHVLEGAGTALVIMETRLHFPAEEGVVSTQTRRATYVFRLEEDGRWRCAVDNSYGTELIGAAGVA